MTASAVLNVEEIKTSVTIVAAMPAHTGMVSNNALKAENRLRQKAAVRTTTPVYTIPFLMAMDISKIAPLLSGQLTRYTLRMGLE